MSSGYPPRTSRPPPPEKPHVWTSGPEVVPAVSAAWISRPRIGESVCGDSVIVRPHGNAVLISVVDALGHGPNAAAVAKTATEWLMTTPTNGESALEIVNGMHKALAGSRGAAALVIVLSARGAEACSVGNVELRSTTAKLPFVLTPGVLGVRLRQPKISFMAGPIVERFVLFSDGISGRFDLKALRTHPTGELATHLFAQHRHAHDDASVVVVDVS
jgi:negative regulator of sigma-B (phosphoserine phosphatase)